MKKLADLNELLGNPSFDPENPQPWEGMSREEQREFNARYGRKPTLPAIEVAPAPEEKPEEKPEVKDEPAPASWATPPKVKAKK